MIVTAHAYRSSKLLLPMQHEGRLPGLSSELGQRAGTKIHITPASVAITCGVWPDPVTSIEPRDSTPPPER